MPGIEPLVIVFAVAQMTAEAPAPIHPDPRTTLRDGLYEHDRSVGLGAEGPVIEALEAATRSGTAPVEGSAVFDVRIGRSGEVLSIRTASEAWSGVADDALEAVASKRARIPASARGVSISIQITSHEQLASGRAPPGPGVVQKAVSTAVAIITLEPGDLAPPARVVSAKVLSERLL